MNVYQKTILPDLSAKRNEKPFVQLPFKAIDEACASLNGNAFKLWLYFARNVINWNYSATDIANRTGMSAEGVKNAFAQLIQNGYIEESNYQFHLYSMKSITSAKTYTFSYDDDETGEVVIPYGTYTEDQVMDLLKKKNFTMSEIFTFIKLMKKECGGEE
jgi:hypothetical protein